VSARPRERWRILGLLAPSWLALGLFFALPILIMLGISFARRGAYGTIEPIGDLWRHVASGDWLGNYRRALDPLYLRIAWRSLWMAGVTTAVCLVVSYPVAYYIALVAPRRWKGLLLVGVVIPFWTSFLIRTSAWMLLLRQDGVINTLLQSLGLSSEPLPMLYTEWAVLAGLVYGELPFMILPLYASLEKLDRTLLEAAADLGAGPARRFWRVTVPLTRPGIVAGLVLVFIPSLGQFIVSDLLGGARSMLIGNVVQNQFLGAANNAPFGAALAMLLMGAVLTMLLAYALYARRTGEP